jgi:hypothetical protein
MNAKSQACLIFVKSTKSEVPRVRDELQNGGYSVCQVMATREEVDSLKSGGDEISSPLRDCIEKADLCVFLVPEEGDDAETGGAAGFSGQLGKRIVGLIGGGRTVYPEGFALAGAMIRMGSKRLSSVIEGKNVWEGLDGSIIPEREIPHQKCQ